MPAKQQYSSLNDGIKPQRFLYVLSNLNIGEPRASKKGNNEGSMGSKSKYRIMNSSQNIQKGSGTEDPDSYPGSKKENTLDIISKSILTCPSVQAGTNEY